ncbi:MAG: hypothetical protein Q9217_006146 [Psora testacea]
MSAGNNEQSVRQDIARLESELSVARAQLTDISTSPSLSLPLPSSTLPTKDEGNDNGRGISSNRSSFNASLIPSHPLLLLTDTALPLGSFAFSSGLESYLAHHTLAHDAGSNSLPNFLHLSLNSLATSTLAFLIAAYKSPKELEELDDTLDACILCPVAKRASISQGRALITVWERAFKAESPPSAAKDALHAFCLALKAPSSNKVDGVVLNGHFPLIYSLVCCAQDLTLHETVYTFLFTHAKTITSAAVRASVLGPYAAQSVLGSTWLREEIEKAMEREWTRCVEQTGQSVPALDVWIEFSILESGYMETCNDTTAVIYAPDSSMCVVCDDYKPYGFYATGDAVPNAVRNAM